MWNRLECLACYATFSIQFSRGSYLLLFIFSCWLFERLHLLCVHFGAALVAVATAATVTRMHVYGKLSEHRRRASRNTECEMFRSSTYISYWNEKLFRKLFFSSSCSYKFKIRISHSPPLLLSSKQRSTDGAVSFGFGLFFRPNFIFPTSREELSSCRRFFFGTRLSLAVLGLLSFFGMACALSLRNSNFVASTVL